MRWLTNDLRARLPLHRERALARARELWASVKPGRHAVQGTAFGVVAGTVALYVVKLSVPVYDLWGAGWSALLLFPTGLLTGAAAAGIGLAAVLLLGALPLRLRTALLFAVALLTLKVLSGTLTERLVIGGFVLASAAAAGAGAAVLWQWRKQRTSGLRRGISVVALALGAGAILFGVRWLRHEGSDNAPIVDAAKATRAKVPHLDRPDPSARGPHATRFLTYGSGRDRRRPEYAERAALRTDPVDGARFLDGWQTGFEARERTRYWGFGPHEMPLNARVFLPDAPGPHPVAVIVHGGHPMGDPSEPGYDYLGEHLASHGYAFVSVDENFLNRSVLGQGVYRENAARGWLVLEHLRALRRFTQAAGNPLSGMLDLDRVALLGHSRGGEAVAIAAALNRMPRFPDDANVKLDFGFGVRAIVAICTTDRQYDPGEAPTRIEDVSYLALEGSNDSDLEHFEGLQQFERVRFTRPGEAFKAALFVHRANHGQYNRVWGRQDKHDFPLSVLINKKPILPAAAQEQIARTYVTAFLDATLRGERGYLPLFQDHRAGARWLPDTIFISRFVASSTRPVATFEEDVDPITTTLPGGAIEGKNLTVWREGAIAPAGFAAQAETRGVFLGWDADATSGVPSYTVQLPAGFAGVGRGGALTFAMADANQNPNPRGRRRQGLAAPTHAPWNRVPRAPIDLRVELVDATGRAARLPLAEVGLLQPQLVATVYKGSFTRQRAPEPMLGTYVIPLERFLAAEPQLDPERLAAVRFVFDRTPAGVVALKDVGFRPAD